MVPITGWGIDPRFRGSGLGLRLPKQALLRPRKENYCEIDHVALGHSLGACRYNLLVASREWMQTNVGP